MKWDFVLRWINVVLTMIVMVLCLAARAHVDRLQERLTRLENLLYCRALGDL